ncbi:MAG TPA: CBS domain-containing protein [Sedimentisphaerales bacterium]|nr:CBS domain-containing protein [Sedimentisphaerales bacterium]HRS12763.1 CBS domain-containing protein [Sedimentisphaerales bacterium]HRV49372.1 CBS domain-containing protein [Sedimentisphaerales bacterium]
MTCDAYCETELAGQSTCLNNPFDEMDDLLARDVMQVGVVSIDRKEPVQKAVALLIERDISGLPVTCDGRLDGMLSEKDLLKLLYEGQYLPGLVEDYMTPHATSFDVEDKVSAIYRHLLERSFRRVPILYQKRLAGMITRADLVRLLLRKLCPSACPAGPNAADEMRAEDAMKIGLLTLRPEAPLSEAMDLIARHHVTGLPVVDGGMNLLGIITEKDVLRHATTPEAIETPVESLMTRSVVSFGRKTSLYRICACLIEHDFHRVPILDGTRLVGIISRSDILRHRAAVFKR